MTLEVQLKCSPGAHGCRAARWTDGLISECSEPQALARAKLACMIDADAVAVSHVSGSLRLALVFHDHVLCGRRLGMLGAVCASHGGRRTTRVFLLACVRSIRATSTVHRIPAVHAYRTPGERARSVRRRKAVATSARARYIRYGIGILLYSHDCQTQ